MNSVYKKGIVIITILFFIKASVLSVTSEISLRDYYSSQDSIQHEYYDLIPIDHIQPPKYFRTLNDIIIGKEILSPLGNRSMIVILASFKDREYNSSHDISYFENLMWGSKPSLKDYYSEVSYGKFTFVPGIVVGWYQTDVTRSWAEENPREFVIKAVETADNDIDFSFYDINNDGIVKNDELTLVIVHNSDGMIDIVHHWETKNEILTNDNVFVEGKYSMMSEWSSMGVFAHEIGHDLNLPDLYDLKANSYGIGDYGLMGYGIYCGPAHMTAWSKIQLGWLNPTIIKTNGTYILNDVETNEEAFILYDPSHSNTEYFLIENRWKGTSYDGLLIGDWYTPSSKWYLDDLPDEGLLIYHIDDKEANNWWNWGWNDVNTREDHKCVDVECTDKPSSHFIDADDLDSQINLGDSEDLWSNTNYKFDDSSLPCNATWYDGSDSGISIEIKSGIGSQMVMEINIPQELHNPETPVITGNSSGKINEEYSLTIFSIDEDDDDLYYYIDWGDNEVEEWIGPYKSGEERIVRHVWKEQNTYSIKVKVRDNFLLESDWSFLEVKISKNKFINLFPWYQYFLDQHLSLFPILRFVSNIS